jgi:hypothetical protein
MERNVPETVDRDDEDDIDELRDKVELIIYTITKYEKQFKAIMIAQEKTINHLMRAVKADADNIDRMIKTQKDIMRFLK